MADLGASANLHEEYLKLLRSEGLYLAVSSLKAHPGLSSLSCHMHMGAIIQSQRKAAAWEPN